jgi:general secretion pathway protein M
MMSENAIVRSLLSSRLVATTVYVVLIFGFIATAWIAVANVLEAQAGLSESQNLLDQLRGRTARGSSGTGEALRPGSPFLEGPTVTVAGASLLQRVAGAVTQAGGSIQSSRVDVEGAQAKDGFVGLLISCEVDQPALQKLLYDLEAGMPFLFIDQLDVQMPQAVASNEAAVGKLRVILGVSGQWQKSR